MTEANRHTVILLVGAMLGFLIGFSSGFLSQDATKEEHKIVMDDAQKVKQVFELGVASAALAMLEHGCNLPSPDVLIQESWDALAAANDPARHATPTPTPIYNKL